MNLLQAKIVNFLRSNQVGKQVLALVKTILFRIEVLPFVLSDSNLELILVTGADSSHYKSLKQFLRSALIHESESKIIAFDLGLTESEINDLKHSFPSIEIREFEYDRYPYYLNIKINAGEYAWKPVIITDILNEYKKAVCWMDAGNIITEKLKSIRRITKKVGMYTPLSSGFISDYTDPRTLLYLDCHKKIYNKPLKAAGTVSVDYHNPVALDIAIKWREYALKKECIAPENYDRKSHRWEQSILSILVYQASLGDHIPQGKHGFEFHQDID